MEDLKYWVKFAVDNWPSIMLVVSTAAAGFSYVAYIKKIVDAKGWKEAARVMIEELEKYKRETGNKVVTRAIALRADTRVNALVTEVTAPLILLNRKK